jgi:uncharacterized protein YjbI with pentapeptide repeats
MADEHQLKLIKEGVEVWNEWRVKHPLIQIDLSGADLSYKYFYQGNLRNANLRLANLTGTNLSKADLDNADLTEANLNEINLSDANLSRADLSRCKIAKAELIGAYLIRANLTEADLSDANLPDVNLTGANLIGANLSRAKLTNATLLTTDLFGAILYQTDLVGAKLFGANLTQANLKGAVLYGAFLSQTNLTGANLTGANLRETVFIKTILEQAVLTGCEVYGISAWDLKGVPADQSKLIITPNGVPEITVDDLQVAQFIYLLLNNKNVRNVIDTITSKAVLILGRFTPERKKVLDLIREELHKHDYVPILFDFENSENQSLLETVMTLAGMARFVIADVTAATMVREELRSIVEKCPAKPIQPILLHGEKEYVTLPEMRNSFRSILPTFAYKETCDVVSQLSESVIQPAENWIAARKAQLMNGDNTDEVIALKKKIEALEKQLQTKSD